MINSTYIPALKSVNTGLDHIYIVNFEAFFLTESGRELL